MISVPLFIGKMQEFGVSVRYGWSDKTPAVMLATLASLEDLYQVRECDGDSKRRRSGTQGIDPLNASNLRPSV